jgi:hypothetical protein
MVVAWGVAWCVALAACGVAWGVAWCVALAAWCVALVAWCVAWVWPGVWPWWPGVWPWWPGVWPWWPGGVVRPWCPRALLVVVRPWWWPVLSPSCEGEGTLLLTRSSSLDERVGTFFALSPFGEGAVLR